MLTPQNYYEDTQYMSTSRFKSFLKCEAAALSSHKFKPTTAMLVGSYVDSYVEGTLDEFKAGHPEIFKGKGKNELKSDFVKAEEICRVIDNDVRLQQFLGGEKQKIFTGNLFGLDWKGKLDIYSKGIAINDLKIMSTVRNKDGTYKDFITPFGYHIQLAVYQELVYQNTGEKLPCYIVALTKESPIDKVIIKVPDHILYRGMEIVKDYTPRLIKLLNREVTPIKCGTCEYCISNMEKTPIISLEDCV